MKDKIKIMIVEDEAIIAEGLRKILSFKGHHLIHPISHGEKVIEICKIIPELVYIKSAALVNPTDHP